MGLKRWAGMAAVVAGAGFAGGCAVYSTPSGDVIAPAPVVVAPPPVVVTPFFWGHSYHYHRAPPPRYHVPRYYGHRQPAPRYYGRPYHRF